MAVVAVAQQEITERGKPIASGVFVGQPAIAIVNGIADSVRFAVIVHSVGAEGSVVGRDQIEIFAGDQAMHGGAEIRQTHRIAPSDFTFECGVVLMNARLTNVEGYEVYGRSAAKSGGYFAARERADAIHTVSGPSLQRVSGDTAFCDALIERISSDGIANSLRCGGGIVNSVAAANHRFVTDAIRQADAWGEVVLVCPYSTASQAVLVCKRKSKIHDTRIQKLQGLVRRNYKAALLTGGWVHKIGIKVGDQVVFVSERSDQLIAQAEIDGESRVNFPGVLNEISVLPVADIHRRTRLQHIGSAG